LDKGTEKEVTNVETKKDGQSKEHKQEELIHSGGPRAGTSKSSEARCLRNLQSKRIVQANLGGGRVRGDSPAKKIKVYQGQSN